MANDSGFAPLTVSETGSSAHGGIGVPFDLKSEHDRVRARPAARGKARTRPTPGTRFVPLPAPAAWHPGALPPQYFAEAVYRESRRSDRSKAPLSVVQYTIDPAHADDPRHFETLLSVLQGAKRETDLLGCTGIDALALLCPDTDGAGAQGLVAKLAPLLGDLPAVMITATYPDHLFDSLSRKTGASATFQALMVPDASPKTVATYPLKAPLDFMLALIALAIFGPLMLLVALAVKLTSAGPVIFKQTRLGRGGVPFTFYKFRSMVVDGDDRIHREYMARLIRTGQGDASAEDADSPSYKMKADPRITKIGKFIRMSSIDELPQLFNVLKGDMSMVGPRPPIPYEAAHYEPWHLQRVLSAKPGITGLWQVAGRSRVTFTEMVRMDLRYVRNCSLRFDLKLLLRTIAVVLRCEGAR